MVGCGEGVVYLTSNVKMRLAYSWARPAILVAGKGRLAYSWASPAILVAGTGRRETFLLCPRHFQLGGGGGGGGAYIYTGFAQA